MARWWHRLQPVWVRRSFNGAVRSLLLAALIALFAGAAFGSDSLPDAIQRQDSVAAHALLDQHADMNATLADGSTALLWAAHWDDAALVDLLLRAGANPQTA